MPTAGTPTELFRFDDVVVEGRLAGASGAIEGEGITALRGPSGAGKSTLLRCCNRLEAPDRGSVRYRGEDLAARDVLAHRREVGMVFQKPVAFAGTVADNVRAAAPDADVAELLERVGLDPALGARVADTLSGGEAQRMCLARALATGPRVLLADEPTASLDQRATLGVEELLRRLRVPVVIVTHDDDQAARLADHELRLEAGRITGGG